MARHNNTAEKQSTSTSLENGNLFQNGNLIYQPAPTSDPRDPLNLPFGRKCLSIALLCLFGALAAAAEVILGGLLPVFVLQYAGQNPSEVLLALSNIGGLPEGEQPLSSLEKLSKANGGLPLWQVYLLASLPVLMMGLCNLLFIPISIAVGRRPVMLSCGVLAIVGAVWAGFSQSLPSHLGARCVQALGAGTVESLIPFIIQDLVFVHQRNTWISTIFATQGVVIVALGAAVPHVILYLGWRYAYWITAIAALVLLMGVFFTLPETRWARSIAEMDGIPREEDKDAPPYPQRTLKHDLALFHGDLSWKLGWEALVSILQTFFYPQVLFITLLNSIMIGATFAATYTLSPALLTHPWSWKFSQLGYSLLPGLIAALAVAAVTGKAADMLANLAAKRRGRRVPENQLINLVLPTVSGIVGSTIFGVSGSRAGEYHWGIFLLGMGLLVFAFLGTSTVGAVYVLEVYPRLAGAALANIASFRCLVAFILSFRISEWVLEMGYLHSMLIYTSLMSAFALMIPVLYIYGPAWRKKWPGYCS
ncbi:major facilitator superfamily transporter [Piedraia hortae CBS 480.64]|uniref:Major facilitator superfamily transporter n=1 Tax=Piedraia hortae CBS 480.64 TaxID=1314780 RepID=A0A6A7C9I5_9PEZI|nr:major facilitator superfamily transporter [Piedraia hortae CBS 480.64]